jgi:N-acetylglutamate synthase-like GNAT family acetyltransferase
MNKSIEVIPYTDNYKQEVINLIVNIQQNEFSISITSDDQPDLNNIAKFYQTNSGNFWIALHENKAVGTISLLSIDNNQAALRKMFVDKNFRGTHFNTAQLLLKALFDWACVNSFKEIYLGTTSKFLAAHRFYEKNGFILIDKSSLPDKFPIMEVDSRFYKYSL